MRGLMLVIFIAVALAIIFWLASGFRVSPDNVGFNDWSTAQNGVWVGCSGQLAQIEAEPEI